LLLEGIGLGAFFTGGATIVFTGANRYLVGPAALLAIGGFGLFATSWLADVYGVATPLDARGRPARFAPALETELGYRYVYDPQFAYRSFLVQGLDLRFGSVRILPRGWFALDHRNVRLRLLGAYRLYGPRPAPAPAARDGSFFDVEGAVTHHRFDPEGFSTLTGELAANGRLDFSRLDPDLSGMFGELGGGFALSAMDYEAPGLELGSDLEQLLLGRFAFGVYLGDAQRGGGEISAYYDHRHDDFAAGLKLTGLGSGVVGHMGLLGRWFFDESIGIAADVQIGSAFIAGLSLLVREGEWP
jgi:hypothetical protein